MELNDTQLLQRARVMTEYLNAPDDKKPKLCWAAIDGYGNLSASQPLFSAKPDWFSRTITYDLDLTAPARGHNPAWLSDFEVGCHFGWRLLTLDEIKAARGKTLPDDHDIQFLSESGWIGVTGVYETTIAFRTKKPANYWLDCRQVLPPKKTRRIPCGPEHFPPGTVVHEVTDCKSYRNWFWVVQLNEWSLRLGAHADWTAYDSASFMNYFERSVDGGRTWLPCYVEVEDNEVKDND